MWCLWNLGELAERMFGTWIFLMLYVFSGLGGSIASLWWHPRLVSAGASGAVFGVAGGLITFFYLGKLRVPHAVIKKNLNSVLCFVGFNVFYGLTQSGIDNAAHLGGLFVGLLIGGSLHRPLPPPKDYSRFRQYIIFLGLLLCLVLGAQFIKTQVEKDPLTKLVRAERLIDLGEFDQAIVQCTKAIELDADFAEAYYNRGKAYKLKGQYDEAISDFTKVIEVNPKDATAYNSLAWLLATCPDDRYRNGIKAIRLAKKALEIKEVAYIMDTLAAAYAEAGRFEDAITTQEKAIALLNQGGSTGSRIDIYKKCLNSYKAHKPWRER
jgi:rhomboid protease GluP